MTVKLTAGMALYHGTDAEFDEECESLLGPAWLSSSRSVAESFAKRSGGWGGEKRIIEYRLTSDVDLHDIHTSLEMQEFAERHGINLDGVEEMRESVEMAGIAGWVIPHNYPDGDDILIVDTDILEFVSSHPL